MSRIKAGFLSPILFEVGGTETWHRTLWANLDARRIDNQGMAVLDKVSFRESTAEKLRVFAPVRAGVSWVLRLAKQVDVLVMWGIARPDQFLPEDRPKVVFVSHGCENSLWTNSVVGEAQKTGAVDQFVAVGKQAAGPVARAGTNAIVIPNGVDVTKHDRPANFHEGKVLGYVGRLSSEKRPDVFVDTIAHLPPHWRGVMVGKDYLDGRIQARANILCPGRIDFPGYTDDVPAAMASFDALLVPSATEGFGYQIAEAWTMGIPVVSTPVGLAAEHPQLVRTLPYLPTGITAARAILADEAEAFDAMVRVERARATVRCRYNAARFGREWSDFLWAMVKGQNLNAYAALFGELASLIP